MHKKRRLTPAPVDDIARARGGLKFCELGFKFAGRDPNKFVERRAPADATRAHARFFAALAHVSAQPAVKAALPSYARAHIELALDLLGLARRFRAAFANIYL